MDFIKVVAIILVILHFIGLASLLGGFLVQVKDIARGTGRIVRSMVDGALTMLVTGLALMSIYSADLVDGKSANSWKLTVKLVVLLVIVALVFIYRKREVAPKWALWTIGALTTLNVVLAVAWK